MTITEFKVKTNEGAYDLEASVKLIGQDLLVAIWSGEKLHIGTVAGRVGGLRGHPIFPLSREK